MELDSLHALYVEGLRDLYSAENQILKALPKMEKAATSAEVKEAFATHRAQTEQQVQRLERIFEELGENPRGKHCKGMEGLIAEGSELMEEDGEPDVLDAGLIAAAQHVEHYEMAGYGTVRTYAELLGLDEQAELLQQTLAEEEETDQILTEIAMTSVNIEAMENDMAVALEEDSEAMGESSESRTSGKTPAKTSIDRGASRSTRSRTKR